MRSRFASRQFLSAILLILIVFLLAGPTSTHSAPLLEADNPIQVVREQVFAQDEYRYTADINQTFIPRPLPHMVGETSERVDLFLEGEVDQLNEFSRLNIRFEGGPLSGEPVITEMEAGQTYLLADGERTLIDNPIALASPDGDFLAYLAAADQIQPIPASDDLPEGYTAYSFNINGPAFANYIRDQMMKSAAASVNALPSPILQRISGQGQLWVNENGLPSRQIMDIEIPEASDDYNARVHIVLDYQFAGEAAYHLPTTISTFAPSQTADQLLPMSEGNAVTATPTTTSPFPFDLVKQLPQMVFCLLMLVVAYALIFSRQQRRLYRAVAIVMTFILLTSPIFQIGSSKQQMAYAAAATPSLMETLGFEAPAASSDDDSLIDNHTLVQNANLNPTAECGDGSSTTDTDADGLTDDVEYCLGLDPFTLDSDRDLITDTIELNGFEFNGQTWYVDPLISDSNLDGLNDINEWAAPIGTAASWDPDNDLVPNVWDDDNDGDGVFDDLDLSPFSLTGFEDSFTFTTQIEDGFTGYQYFELQIRPEDAAHLSYSSPMLDWPHDEKGQLQDLDNSKDDINIAPMLAIRTDQLPEQALMDLYGLSVFQEADGQTLYVPLAPVNDGGQIVAFQARLAYGPETAEAITWDDVQFVWLVYMANDELYDVDYVASGDNIYTEIIPINAFEEPYQITGWDIGKHDDYDFLILGTPNTPTNDRDLFQVLFGLSTTYLNHQGPDLAEIDNRFGNTNTDPILTWGVAAADVELYRPDPAPGHPDGAIFDMSREVPRFLNTHSYPMTGAMVNLVIATEQRISEASLDDYDPAATGFSVNLNTVPWITLRHARLSSFAYGSSGWEVLDGDAFLEGIANRYDDLSADLAELQAEYPAVTQSQIEKGIGLMYVQWNTGQSRITALDGTTVAPVSESDVAVFDRLNLPLLRLGAYLLEVAGLLNEDGSDRLDTAAARWSYIADENTEHFFTPPWLEWVWDLGGFVFDTQSRARIFFSAKGVLRTISSLYTIYWTVKLLYTAYKTGEAIKTISVLGYKVLKTIKKVGSWKITLLLVTISIGFMIYLLVTADNVYEIQWILSYYLTSIAITLILVFLTFNVYTAIFIALLYITDLIILLVTGTSYFEEVTQAIAKFFYNFDFVTSINKLNFGKLELELTNGNALQVGSRLSITSGFSGRTEGNENARDEDIENSWIYGQLLGSSNDDSVAITDKNGHEDRTCAHPQGTAYYLCHNAVGIEVEFSEAKRNIPLILDTKVRAQVVVKECRVTICNYPKEAVNWPEDLEDDGWDPVTIYIDVIPDTLDGFWNWNEINNLDADGDGLASSIETSLGTDANDWDSDDDGLSDDFEYQNQSSYGTDPLDADSDDDGLLDGLELRWATLISSADSDNDGLNDAAERFHQLADGSWAGGGWLVNVPGGSSYWLFSTPLDADVDGDGLNDATEMGYGTSPYAVNAAPRLTLSSDHWATSPAGASGIYAIPGDTVTLSLALSNTSAQPITDSLSLCLPASLTNVQVGTMQGDESPAAASANGCYTWTFSGPQTLQVFESVNVEITAEATGSGRSLIAASLPYVLSTNGEIITSLPLNVDNDTPTVGFAAPYAGQIFGHGTYATVIGGRSSDDTSWVDHVEVTLPGQGTVTISDVTSPWATTWNIPVETNGLFTLSAQAFDAAGQSSAIETVTVLVDNYSPFSTLDLIDGQTIAATGDYNLEIPLSGSATDEDPAAAVESGLERIQISLDGSPWRTVWEDNSYPVAAAWNTLWTLPGGASAQGEHTVSIRAIDRAGNRSYVETKTITIDLLAPTDEQTNRTLLTDPPYYQTGAVVTLEGVANDAGNLPLAPVAQELEGDLHSITDATIWLQPDSRNYISGGMTATWIGDFNNDRLADLAVGLPAANNGAGKVFIVNGAAGDWPVPDLGVVLDDADSSFVGAAAAGLGQSLEPAGDVNGDGFADLLIGDFANNRVFLLFGSPTTHGHDTLLDEASTNAWVELTLTDGLTLQQAAAAYDVNGDGFDDLLFSATNGAVYLLLGEASPNWRTVDVQRFAAAVANLGAPASVAGVGDVNDDQKADYAFGLGGTVYLFNGEIGLGNSKQVPLTLGDAAATFASNTSQPDILSLGDVNGDTIDDFIFSSGSAPIVVFGDSLATQTLGGFSPAADGFVAAAGDVDRDGRNDILVGNADGDAYLLLGSNLQSVAATFAGVDGAATTPFAAGSDLNSDGASDILLIPSTSAAIEAGLESFGAAPFVNPLWLPGVTPLTLPGEVGKASTEGFGPSLAGATLYVDDDGCQGQTPCYTSVQTAIDNASSGDTIEIFSGVYGAFTLNTADLTIQGRLADAVMIDGSGGEHAVRVNIGGGQLNNLTLRNATYGLYLAGPWGLPDEAVTLNRVIVQNASSNTVRMHRDTSLVLNATTLVGTTNHISVYGVASGGAAWSSGPSDSRFTTNAGGAVLAGSSNELYLIEGGGTQDTEIYNLASGTWSGMANTPYAVDANSAAAIDGNDDIWLARANAFAEGVNGRVRVIEYVADDQVYAGGDFTQAGGQTANYIAMWNGSSWEAMSGSDAPNSPVHALEYDTINNVLYVGGDFGLKRWFDSTNTWQHLGSTTTGYTMKVYALTLTGGNLYFGGDIDRINQASASIQFDFRNIGRYNVSAGSYHLLAQANSCEAGLLETVTALESDTNYVYIGLDRMGSYYGWNSFLNICFEFSTGHVTRYSISQNQFVGLPFQANGTAGSPAGSSLMGIGAAVHSLALEGNRLVVGGQFSGVQDNNNPGTYSYSTNNLFIYNLSGGNTITVDTLWDINAPVTSVSIRNNNIFIAGDFTQAKRWGQTTVNANYIARINTSNNPVALDNGLSGANLNPVVAHGNGNQVAYVGGNFTAIDGSSLAANRFAYWNNSEFSGQGFFHYDRSANSWSAATNPPFSFGIGAVLVGDGGSNIYVAPGGGSTAFYRFNGSSWTSRASLPTAPATGATMQAANGDLYALLGGSSTFCFYDVSANSWDCGLASLPGTAGVGADLAWDGQDDLYATIGGNGRQFYSYSLADNSWTTLGDGSGTTTNDADTPEPIQGGSGLAFYDQAIYMVPGGDANTLYSYGPIGVVNQRLALNDVAIVTPETNAAATWINITPDNSFSVTANNLTLVGGNSTNWQPNLISLGIVPLVANYAAAAFLDSAHGIYRLTENSLLTAGYHSYRPDAVVGTSGQEFSSIQAAINSGANRVQVEAGVYQETINLASGVTVIGAGANRSVIEAPVGSGAAALVQAEGSTGTTFRGFGLAGDNSMDGFLAEAGAQNILLTRNIIQETNNGIVLDGSTTEVDVINLTVANNANGLVASNCAPVTVRNTVFAYNSGVALQYQGCAPTQLHTYNSYWHNGTDLSPLSPGSGEIFLNPLFTDLSNYLADADSPLINAGAPGDPTPPGTGGRVDIGYVEQTGASFYADDDYCAICANDGLTWGVDAFDTIQAALDAAAAELLLLGTDQLRYTVGVGPGSYAETVAVPSYVDLVGADAETTIITSPNSSTIAVTFYGVNDASISNFTIMGLNTTLSVNFTANNILITRNIITSPNAGAVVVSNSSSAEVAFNTITDFRFAAVAVAGLRAWVNANHNVISGGTEGLPALNTSFFGSSTGQIFSDYNLIDSTIEYDSNVTPGVNDIINQAPLLATGSYRLQAASPAVDAADPSLVAPNGGGVRADLGYWELRSRPFTLFLGAEDVSTAVAYAGVAQVEYAVVPVVDASAPLTSTLPTVWNTATLDDPNAPVTGWSVDYTPSGPGTYRLYTRATDVVNNSESNPLDWYAGSFIVDGTAPVVNWLSPASGSTTAEAVELRAEVSDYNGGDFTVDSIYFLVDGNPVAAAWAAEPWSESSGSARTFRAWVNLTPGSHAIQAVAADKAGNSGQSAAITLNANNGPLVDSTNPSLAVASPSNYSLHQSSVTFTGTASDSGSGLAVVEISLDGGISWQPAAITGGSWAFSHNFGDGTDIDYVGYTVQVRATDRAGNANTITRYVLIDNTAPRNLLPVSFSSEPGTHFDQAPSLTVSWQTPLDGDDDIDVYLTIDHTLEKTGARLNVSSVNSVTGSLPTPGVWYLHMEAVDGAGNTLIEHFGPWYVGSADDPGTPLGNRVQTITIDGVINLEHDEWTDDEQLDQDENGLTAPVAQVQSLYATWDGDNLYLGWQKAWWDLDGTLWAYLDTGAGGSTQTVVGSHVLPFAADYALMVDGSAASEGLLWSYNGSSWTSSPLTFAHTDTGDTEIMFPVAVDQVSTLRLLAFAEDNAAAPWSIFPTTNSLAGLWTGYYEWQGLETIVLVNENQPTAPNVRLHLDTAVPAHITAGPGDTVTYLIDVTNQEAAAAPNLQLTFTVDPNLTLQSVTGATCADCSNGNSWLLDVPSVAANGQQQISLTAQLASDLTGITHVAATAELTAAAAVREAVTLLKATDGDIPTLAISAPAANAIGSGQQTLFGTASDTLIGSGVVAVEYRENGGSWQTANGTTVWSVNLNIPAGSTTWVVDVRAVDGHGLTSALASISLIVDEQAPAITANMPTSVNGAVATITGTALDSFPVGAEVAALYAQLGTAASPWLAGELYAPDATGTQAWRFSWSLPVVDGISQTVRFQAIDEVGNITLTDWLTTVVDTVAPAVAVTQVVSPAYTSNTAPVLSGTASDGYGIDTIQVSVYLPDGTAYQAAAALNGSDWAFTPAPFTLLGEYSLWVEASDLAGNSTLLGAYDILVTEEPIMGLMVSNDGPTVWGQATNLSASVSAGTALSYTWDLGDGTTAAGAEVSHTYAASGVYTATVTVSNPLQSVTAPTLVEVTNEAPVGSSDAYTTDEETALVVAAPGVLTNDADPDGHAFTAQLDSTTSSGSLSFNPDGSFTYTPTLDFYGEDSFTYVLDDGDKVGLPATVVISVTNSNDAPDALDDSYVVVEDTSSNLDVLANDSYLPDPTETLTLTAVSSPDQGGTAIISGTEIIYTPALNFFGAENFTYTLSDGELTDTATVSLTVTNVNDAPELIELVIQPEQPNEGELVQFTATVVDPGFAPLDHEIGWDFGDGTTVSGVLTPTHTYADDGVYNLTIVVTDTLGASSSYSQSVVVANVAPTVTISSSTVITGVGEIIDFSGVMTDPGQDSHDILWDLGDGTTVSHTLATSHAYAASGTYTVTLTVTDDEGGVGSDQLVVTIEESLVYVSTVIPGLVNGEFFDYSDILVYDLNQDTWNLYFDGSDVGLWGVNLSALTVLDDGTILMSFDRNVNLAGAGQVRRGDIVRFIPTSLGLNTAGSFMRFFDGSDVGLSTQNETIDGLSLTGDGRIVISTLGNFDVPGLSGNDRDLIAFTPSSLGATTTGSWAMYFDGSDVGLNRAEEDIWGVSIDGDEVYLSTLGNFDVPGVTGTGDDIFLCTAPTLGATTVCDFSMYWVGSDYGFSYFYADGISVGEQEASMTAYLGEGMNDQDGAEDEGETDDPEVMLSSSAALVAGGEAVAFTFAYTFPEGNIYEVVWDFGDEETLHTTSVTAQHTYAASGRYTVTVTIIDGDVGVSVAQMEITVEEARHQIFMPLILSGGDQTNQVAPEVSVVPANVTSVIRLMPRNMVALLPRKELARGREQRLFLV